MNQTLKNYLNSIIKVMKNSIEIVRSQPNTWMRRFFIHNLQWSIVFIK
jgi:hypothetical protein